jgi:hypothetical protein
MQERLPRDSVTQHFNNIKYIHSSLPPAGCGNVHTAFFPHPGGMHVSYYAGNLLVLLVPSRVVDFL